MIDAIKQFPHCDALVLHAPGECSLCDRHPDWQQLRMMWGICFTGEQESTKWPCPATLHRDVETINRWGGNRPDPTAKRIRELVREALPRLRRFIRELGD